MVFASPVTDVLNMKGVRKVSSHSFELIAYQVFSAHVTDVISISIFMPSVTVVEKTGIIPKLCNDTIIYCLKQYKYGEVKSMSSQTQGEGSIYLVS